jgi:hypothetical protein
MARRASASSDQPVAGCTGWDEIDVATGARALTAVRER